MTYIRIRYSKQGGHFHCRVFTSQIADGTYANCGSLVFDENEFAEVRDKLSGCDWREEKGPRQQRISKHGEYGGI